MQIETRKGFDNTFVDFDRRALIAGLKLTYLLSLAGTLQPLINKLSVTIFVFHTVTGNFIAIIADAGVLYSKLFFISKY